MFFRSLPMTAGDSRNVSSGASANGSCASSTRPASSASIARACSRRVEWAVPVGDRQRLDDVACVHRYSCTSTQSLMKLASPLAWKSALQGRLIVVLAHPVEERLPPLRLARVVMEERVEHAGARLADMAEAQRELRQRLARGAALEQHEQPGRETRAVGARLAVQQRRRAHLTEDVVQPQDPLALRRAAAVQRRIDELEAKLVGGRRGSARPSRCRSRRAG